ncbi:MAG: hypothetical protein GX454_05855 [Brooklawnia sp.]|nr:hypothetical protein [Brooklawnia sp.]
MWGQDGKSGRDKFCAGGALTLTLPVALLRDAAKPPEVNQVSEEIDRILGQLTRCIYPHVRGRSTSINQVKRWLRAGEQPVKHSSKSGDGVPVAGELPAAGLTGGVAVILDEHGAVDQVAATHEGGFRSDPEVHADLKISPDNGQTMFEDLVDHSQAPIRHALRHALFDPRPERMHRHSVGASGHGTDLPACGGNRFDEQLLQLTGVPYGGRTVLPELTGRPPQRDRKRARPAHLISLIAGSAVGGGSKARDWREIHSLGPTPLRQQRQPTERRIQCEPEGLVVISVLTNQTTTSQQGEILHDLIQAPSAYCGQLAGGHRPVREQGRVEPRGRSAESQTLHTLGQGPHLSPSNHVPTPFDSEPR